MSTLRHFVSAICLGTCLAGSAAYAADAATAPATGTGSVAGHHWRGHHHGGPLGGFGHVLHKLNLSAEQKTQIKSILAGEKSQFQALHTSVKSNMEALATMPPTDSGYAALVQTAQTNAATRIKLASETWTMIYQNVLTAAQQKQIPTIVAAEQAARQEKMATWRAQHPQT
jgi:Spy/CpxP family protein refolding chaperone